MQKYAQVVKEQNIFRQRNGEFGLVWVYIYISIYPDQKSLFLRLNIFYCFVMDIASTYNHDYRTYVVKSWRRTLFELDKVKQRQPFDVVA